MLKVLDLSNVPSWLSVVSGIASRTVPIEIRRRLRTVSAEEMYSDTLSYLLEAGDALGVSIDYDEYVELFEKCFLREYAAIRAFHACRPTRLDTYKNEGILRHSRQLIEQLAMETFLDYSTRDKILSAIDAVSKEYRVGDSGTVYCFTNQTHPLESSRNHYLRYGSEYLKGLANRLELDGEGILTRRGKAHLIEVIVPISTVVYDYRVDLWRTMLTWYFKSESNAPASNDEIPSCIMIRGDISTDCIVGFIPVADAKLQFW